MPKDHFMWYLTNDKGHTGHGHKRTARFIFGAFCGNKNEALKMSCVATVQYGHNTSVHGFQTCQNFSDALIMVNNAGETGSTVRSVGNVRKHDGEVGRGLV